MLLNIVHRQRQKTRAHVLTFSVTPVRVGADHVLPSTKVRDLGIFIDSDVTMRSHVTRTVCGCFAVLRQLRSIRRSMPNSVFQTLVVALVIPRLDYGPAFQLRRFQSVLNAAARLIHRSPRHKHISPRYSDTSTGCGLRSTSISS